MTRRYPARRWSWCRCCMDGDHDRTIQWFWSIQVPRSRSCWGPRHPIVKYRCQRCGELVHE